jgi:diadenosine tetraphosphate (Ap4A) HIT family hydrolase
MSDIRSCPFCALKTRVLKENALACLFLSNPRKTKGHSLVIPKRHIEQPWQLTSAELLAVFELVTLAGQAIALQLADGFDIRQNYRPFMAESATKVDHVHFHIIPRSNKDHIYTTAERYDNRLWQPLGDEEHSQISALLDS